MRIIRFYIDRFLHSEMLSFAHTDEAMSNAAARLRSFAKLTSRSVDSALVTLKLFLAWSFSHTDWTDSYTGAHVKLFANGISPTTHDTAAVAPLLSLAAKARHEDNMVNTTRGTLALYIEPLIKTVDRITLSLGQFTVLSLTHTDELLETSDALLALFARAEGRSFSDASVRPASNMLARADHKDVAAQATRGNILEYIRITSRTFDWGDFSLDGKISLGLRHVDLARSAIAGVLRQFQGIEARTNDGIDAHIVSQMLAKNVQHTDIAISTMECRVVKPATLHDLQNETLASQAEKSMFDVSYITL